MITGKNLDSGTGEIVFQTTGKKITLTKKEKLEFDAWVKYHTTDWYTKVNKQ